MHSKNTIKHRKFYFDTIFFFNFIYKFLVNNMYSQILSQQLAKYDLLTSHKLLANNITHSIKKICDQIIGLGIRSLGVELQYLISEPILTKIG